MSKPPARSAIKFDLFADAAHKHKIETLGDPLQLIPRHIEYARNREHESRVRDSIDSANRETRIAPISNARSKWIVAISGQTARATVTEIAIVCDRQQKLVSVQWQKRSRIDKQPRMSFCGFPATPEIKWKFRAGVQFTVVKGKLLQ